MTQALIVDALLSEGKMCLRTLALRNVRVVWAQGYRMMVIGTTSELGFLREVGLHRAFGTALQIPALAQRSAFEAALRTRRGFSPELFGRR